jgi:hypothetical protein
MTFGGEEPGDGYIAGFLLAGGAEPVGTGVCAKPVAIGNIRKRLITASFFIAHVLSHHSETLMAA